MDISNKVRVRSPPDSPHLPAKRVWIKVDELLGPPRKGRVLQEDLLIHGDSVYDIIDKQDHGAIQAELGRGVPQHQTSASALHHGHHHHGTHGTQLDGEQRMFLCRMNVSRNARRQMRFGDQKVVLVQGHYLSYLPLCSRNEPVFIATCTPIAMPETRECVVQGATNVFTTIHSMDMKIVHVDRK
ncbi:conserved hypothetical protein [Culex quinquefasciatus]|uniref:Uncharacterized protein n=1 Tax=Culex quinquefasciatus TaxID=7176 RepID=B0WJB8_CULQU|nr:conserved hypothetical protein [Culex quinquefasciatus]|eukprot:XP_001848802.1 conserved hypothetical protein [Culex quinquefasciatus]